MNMDAIPRCCGVVVDLFPRQLVNRGEGKTARPFRMQAMMLVIILCALVREPTLVLCWTPVGSNHHYCTRGEANPTRSDALTEGNTVERIAWVATFTEVNILYAGKYWHPPPKCAMRYYKSAGTLKNGTAIISLFDPRPPGHQNGNPKRISKMSLLVKAVNYLKSLSALLHQPASNRATHNLEADVIAAFTLTGPICTDEEYIISDEGAQEI